MRSSEGERLCQEAQVYYYDLLCQEEAVVPEAVRRHVAACSACLDQMRRLREALFEAEHPPGGAGVCQDETIEALAQQFQLLDERVTCSEAKPRLPELALAWPQIRIPTPITVHVDHCPQCAEDLAAIRELDLTAGQLKRLGRLLETGRIAPLKREWEARDAGDGLVPPVPESAPDKSAGIACHDITMADLFDDVVPSGATPSARETTSARQEGIVRHVRSCPVCRERVRTLQRTIEEIVARADSEIATVYHADNDAEQASGGAESEYPYPVSVQVLHGQSDVIVEAHAARVALATGLRKLERSAKPLAALVLIGVALTLLLRTTTPTASGTNIGDVDKILAKIGNVHIDRRDSADQPIQELWLARPSKILVIKTKESCVLYDLAHNRKRTLDLDTGVRTSERLDRDDRTAARQFMAGYLRQIVTEVAPDAELHRAGDQVDSGTGQALDVYELPSSQRAEDAPVRSYRLVYIDRASGRPQKMELYRHKPGEDRGEPLITTIFTYPTDQEMNSALQSFFPAP
jgi:hypothetical protein